MNAATKFSGAKIREARRSRGLTQAALAAVIGTRERNIVRWENDQHEPRFQHVEAIARATDRPLEFFAADDEQPAPADADDEESHLVDDLVTALLRVIDARTSRDHPTLTGGNQ